MNMFVGLSYKVVTWDVFHGGFFSPSLDFGHCCLKNIFSKMKGFPAILRKENSLYG